MIGGRVDLINKWPGWQKLGEFSILVIICGFHKCTKFCHPAIKPTYCHNPPKHTCTDMVTIKTNTLRTLFPGLHALFWSVLDAIDGLRYSSIYEGGEFQKGSSCRNEYKVSRMTYAKNCPLHKRAKLTGVFAHKVGFLDAQWYVWRVRHLGF